MSQHKKYFYFTSFISQPGRCGEKGVREEERSQKKEKKIHNEFERREEIVQILKRKKNRGEIKQKKTASFANSPFFCWCGVLVLVFFYFEKRKEKFRYRIQACSKTTTLPEKKTVL